MDPALVISQSALETANWTSSYWAEYLNPAGIGIGYNGAPSYTWATGEAAARNQIVRLYIYSAGPIEAGNPLYPYRNDGPSYQRLFDLGYDGQARVLDDLTGKWATDPLYGQKVASRGSGIYSPGSADPGEPALFPATVDASGGNDPTRTRDGDLGTSWVVQGVEAPPPGGYVTYNFGASVVLESTQWLFRRGGFADAYSVQTSSDGSFWSNANNYSGSTAWTWNVLSGSLTTKYIRFRFANPNQSMALGYLAEVEFYGHYLNGVPTATSTPYPRPTATNTPVPTDTPAVTNTPTPTRTPAALDGEIIAAIGGGGSNSGNWSGYVRDGSLRTTWQTITTAVPTRAQVYVDLGRSGTITGAEFTFRRTSGARSYQIRVSNDKVSWITVATFTYAEPLVWQRAKFSASGRYVQFLFLNTSGVSALGYLAEIRVYGVASSFAPAEDTPVPSPTATFTAEPSDTPKATDASPIAPPSGTVTVVETTVTAVEAIGTPEDGVQEIS
jgi:hypothetical protein